MSVAPADHGDILAHETAPARIWGSIWRALEAYTFRAARTEQIRALQAKSDDELKAMGIDRERIVCHVFSDRRYI